MSPFINRFCNLRIHKSTEIYNLDVRNRLYSGTAVRNGSKNGDLLLHRLSLMVYKKFSGICWNILSTNK